MVLIEFKGKTYDTEKTYKIDCSLTSVSVIPDTFLNLEYLNCNNSRVSEIPKTLIKLTYLDCSDTQVSIIPDTLTKLIKLDCSNTNVSVIPDTLIDLDEIDCNTTNVSAIPGTLTKLNYLYCSDTQISTFPDTLVNLKSIDFNNTQVSEIPNTFVKLKNLYFNNTQVSEIPNTLVTLENLYCEETQVSEIPNTLINIKTLVCNNTGITEIPNTFVNIISIDCRNTQVSEIPNTLINLKELQYEGSLISCLPINIKNNIMIDLPLCDDKDILSKFIGPDQGATYEEYLYKIYLSQEFVKKTQYRISSDEEIGAYKNYGSHIIFKCPVGHLHAPGECGVPTEVKQCNVEGCKYLIGGRHHYLAPGNYIVYHDGYEYAKIWYGDFPVGTYGAYLLLVEQYNMAAKKYNDQNQDKIDYIEPVEALNEPGIASKTAENMEISEDSVCNICGDEVKNDGTLYMLPDCGHLIHEECLVNARGGDLANVNDPNEQNMNDRKCGKCSRRFRFRAYGKQKYKLDTKRDQGCVIV
jgi:Leucine-rich repeat (LRR) protein